MLKKILSLIWFWWKKIGLIIGDLVTKLFLLIFYFSIFALIALPFRLFNRPQKSKASNFHLKKSTISSLREFEKEF